MSIGTYVASVFNYHVSTTKCKIGEINLFRLLIEAINSVGFFTHCINPTEIHGYRSFVEFISSTGWVRSSGTLRKRKELADILFLIYSPSNHKCRVTFMQNKFQNNNCRTKINKTDLFQLELLSQRPRLTSAPMFIPGDLLYNASVSSIGSYGLFIYDSSKCSYEMVYFSADELLPHKLIGSSSVRQADFNNSFNVLRSWCGIEDINATDTLEGFVDRNTDPNFRWTDANRWDKD